MTKAPITLQDLRRRLYVKAKAEPSWRFWGYMATSANERRFGPPMRWPSRTTEPQAPTGLPSRSSKQRAWSPFSFSSKKNWCSGAIDPNGRGRSGYRKRAGKFVSSRFQGALKLILEPIFEADFQPGSYGYRPKKSAHAAVQRVSEAILQGKTYVVDLDLKSYFGAPGKAGRFQRVQFPPRQGERAAPPGIEPWAHGGNDMG